MKDLPLQPNPLLDSFIPAFSAWSLVTAVSAGVLDALSEDERGAAEVARDLDLDRVGVERLMTVLAHLGYVEQEGERYRLSSVARQCLTQESPHRLVNWVRFCRTQLLAMSRLQSTLSTGQGVDLYDLMKTPEELRVHQLAMAETAMPVAEWVAAHIPVPKGAERMLDIGGSHGLYSAAICRHSPPLLAEVMELPGVIDVARSVARELGTTEFVKHIEGDFRSVDLAKEYSVVFFGNLIHHLTTEQLPSVLEKVWNHLTPGGTIAIWDIEETSGEGDLVSSLFSLFFYLTSTGGCHPQRQIRTLLQKAGFGRFEVLRPDHPSLHVLYVGRKSSS